MRFEDSRDKAIRCRSLQSLLSPNRTEQTASHQNLYARGGGLQVAAATPLSGAAAALSAPAVSVSAMVQKPRSVRAAADKHMIDCGRFLPAGRIRLRIVDPEAEFCPARNPQRGGRSRSSAPAARRGRPARAAASPPGGSDAARPRSRPQSPRPLRRLGCCPSSRTGCSFHHPK